MPRRRGLRKAGPCASGKDTGQSRVAIGKERIGKEPRPLGSGRTTTKITRSRSRLFMRSPAAPDQQAADGERREASGGRLGDEDDLQPIECRVVRRLGVVERP